MRFLPEGKIQVFELAQILGVNSAKLITLLGDLGVKVADQTALVDASLESRLKGLIRRPTAGGRGLAAARPEPTWLTSLHWPKAARDEEELAPEASAVGPRAPKGAGVAETAESAVTRAKPRRAELLNTKEGAGETEAQPSEPAPRKGPVVPLDDEFAVPVPRTTEKGPGPVLPSGRTPTPPPPLPVRRPLGSPPASGYAPVRPGGGASRPLGPSAGPAGQERPRPAYPPRQPGAYGPRPGGPARPYGAPPAGRPGFDRPPAGRGPAGPDRGFRPPGGPARDYPARGGPGGPARPAPGRSPAPAGPGAGRGATAPGRGPDTRGRRGGGGAPSRTRGPRQAPAGRAWQGDDDAERRVARGRHGRRGDVAPKVEEPALVRATEVVIGGPIAVRDLAERMGVSGAELIKSLIRLGIVASLNQVLDPESARIAVSEMGLVVHAVQPEAVEGEATPEEKRPPVPEEDRPEDLKARSPIVTVMGHVDHGKTSLLDAIRKTNVTAGEAGGITQHIGASTVEWNGKRIVFLDTPGHEAFTAMRARGAQVTDIAVLVVAADDGVMPQTLEAINHARAAKVPILVALNKIDKDNALPDRVKKQLSEIGLASEDWGGNTVVVPVSAKVGTGINDLLDMILLMAEMGELKANPDRRARGTVIETRLDKGLGPVASVLVQSGTLRVGDPILAGTAFGRVRAMADDKGQRLEEAGPATPVEVTGLDELPAAGDVFRVLADEKMAREIAAQRDLKRRVQELGGGQAATSLEDLFRRAIEGEKKQLNLVLKADVQGSLEALKQSFEKLEEPEVGIEIIHTGVGGVRETDVMLAAASDAIIIAFNVTPDPGARQAAEQRRVDVRTYRIIYDAINDVKAALKGLRAPIYKEVVLGHATIRQLFKIPKVGTIAGCYVTDGKIARKNKLRVVRDGVIVHDGPIASLRHVKDDVRDVATGFECGIGLEGFQDIKEGDILEAFAMEEVAR